MKKERRDAKLGDRQGEVDEGEEKGSVRRKRTVGETGRVVEKKKEEEGDRGPEINKTP